ncbi:amidase family protein [Erythrobacteraceae bacterium WH01K]|nr:amidase family protein [Erythrobacteraceae bacterium WH01K]
MTFPSLTDQPGALETASLIREGRLSPSEATDRAIARIEARDGPINAVVVRAFDRARDTAKAMDRQTPLPHQTLFGVPLTIKESFDVAGLPTCWGLKDHAGRIAQADAAVVRQLKAAGAVLLGKTNVPPGLADWQSFNPLHGRTRNPHDVDRSAGGSSGGAAAAVASGMVAAEFGTDIGGSVRVPAHFCGIWGHKPSWGLVSSEGHTDPAFADRGRHDGALNVAGPLARNAADLAAMLELTATIPLLRRDKSLETMRFLALLDHPASPIDDDVRQPIEAALDVLRGVGASVDVGYTDLPDLAGDHAAYLKMLNITMARGAPSPGGHQASAADWFDLMDAQVRCERSWARLFESYDFVLAPPANILAFPHRNEPLFRGKIAINGEERDAAEGLAWAGIATFPNLPATVLPVGASGDLPCGMQVIGPRWSDFDCIAAAEAIGARLHG